ncbi:MAG: hypothetical protein ACI9S9_004761 [Planctomycetota bacterium]|jgi:hypothetical protein
MTTLAVTRSIREEWRTKVRVGAKLALLYQRRRYHERARIAAPLPGTTQPH